MDGSRWITLPNRKFLRKFTPIHEDPSDKLKQFPHMPVSQQTPNAYPAVPDQPNSQQEHRTYLPMPQQQPVNTVPTSTATMPPPGLSRTVGDWLPPGMMAQSQH